MFYCKVQSNFYCNMPQKFSFLCGNFNNRNYIYATKFDQHPWHYFEELHSIISEHDSLPAQLENKIKSFTKVQTVEVILNDEQVKNYYENGKFVFKYKELKTFITLAGKSPEDQPTKRKVKSTRDLTFNSGETNPLLFLAEFEKCDDIKTDQDKTYKIRNFVDEEHKPEFSQLHFTSDWPTIKTTFLNKYSLTFIENKKREMNFDFNGEPSLRSFVNRKFSSLAKYTTLSLINQMEIILNELPNNIAHLFMVHEKFDCDKNDILDFCDSIQEVVEKYIGDKNTQDTQLTHNEPLNRMEVFNYDTDNIDDSDEPMLQSDFAAASTSRGRGRGRGRVKGRGIVSPGKIVKRGRPSKKLNSIQEEDLETDRYDFLDQISNSSHSSWSSRN